MFENFHRIYITIQYCGHLLLLAELHKHLPKKKKFLYQVLMTPVNKNTLSRLKSRKIINDEQWNILYPINGKTDSEQFDITLCFILLRNLCPTLVTPVNGWDQPPLIGDRSTEANMVRLKLFRNEFSHGPWNWLMSNTTFHKKWTELEIILNELGYKTLPSKIDLADLKTGPLDSKGEKFQTQQKFINELLKQEQKQLKFLCCSGTLILSVFWLFVSIVVYQYLNPGSTYRYYACKIGSKQPPAVARFEFIPTRDPYMFAVVNGIEFSFEALMEKTLHTDYISHQKDDRYFLNIDRCAFGGITMVDLHTDRKPVRGPDVFVVNAECSSVFYYTEVPHGQWVKYKSVRNIHCDQSS